MDMEILRDGCPPANLRLFHGFTGGYSFIMSWSEHYQSLVADVSHAEQLLDNATLRVMDHFARLARSQRVLSVFDAALRHLTAARELLCIALHWPALDAAPRAYQLMHLCQRLASSGIDTRGCTDSPRWAIEASTQSVLHWIHPIFSARSAARGAAVNLGELLHPLEYSTGEACKLDHVARPLQAGVNDNNQQPWRDVTGHFVHHLSVPSLLNHLAAHGTALSKFVVNLGAADGGCRHGPHFDPANCLVQQEQYAGLMVEGNPSESTIVDRFSARSDIVVHRGQITPESLLHILDAATIPESPDLLKIDLDNGDVDFMEASLSRIRPKLIHFEFSGIFPPPIIYRENFTNVRLPGTAIYQQRALGAARSRSGLFPGGSLSAFIASARHFGYGLVHVESINAVLVRMDLPGSKDLLSKHTVRDAWLSGWFCSPLRSALWFSHIREYNKDYLLDFRLWANPKFSGQALLTLVSAYVEMLGGQSGAAVLALDRPGT